MSYKSPAIKGNFLRKKKTACNNNFQPGSGSLLRRKRTWSLRYWIIGWPHFFLPLSWRNPKEVAQLGSRVWLCHVFCVLKPKERIYYPWSISNWWSWIMTIADRVYPPLRGESIPNVIFEVSPCFSSHLMLGQCQPRVKVGSRSIIVRKPCTASGLA